MFGFKSAEQRAEEIVEQIRREESALTARIKKIIMEDDDVLKSILTRLENSETLKTLFNKVAFEDKETRRKSDEPWVEIVSESIHPTHGIQLRLDWNDAFIKYLKLNGYTQGSDEEIVDQWLRSLNNEGREMPEFSGVNS